MIRVKCTYCGAVETSIKWNNKTT